MYTKCFITITVKHFIRSSFFLSYDVYISYFYKQYFKLYSDNKKALYNSKIFKSELFIKHLAL